MENVRHISHLEIVKRDWRKILVVALFIVLLSMVFTLVRPFLYRATVSIFVVQKSSFSIDAYSASKSEERIANKLAQVIVSSSFLDKVVNAGFDVDKSYFPTDERKKRDKWSKTVETAVPAGLSKLEISVYHSDPNQALQISNAIAYALTAGKRDFIGIEDVDLKVLDSPLVSKYPVRPNVIFNLALGIIVGLILGVAFVIASYDPRRDKLFGIHHKGSPHLIDTAKVEHVSVEKAIAEATDVPEIRELEDVQELEAAEDVGDRHAPLSGARDIKLPDVEAELEEEAEDEGDEEGEADDDLVPPRIPDYNNDKATSGSKHKDIAEFEGEDEIVGMK